MIAYNDDKNMQCSVVSCVIIAKRMLTNEVEDLTFNTWQGFQQNKQQMQCFYCKMLAVRDW